MKLSVVILNWNGKEMLQRFLPSVLNYSRLDEVEICVADNASTDGSSEMLTADFPSVRQIILEENFGFAEGYNRALQQVEAEYVLLLNSDVEVTPHWLVPLLEYMDQHPDVAACQPKILSESCRSKFEYAGAAGGFIDRYGYPFCRGRIFEIQEEDRGQYDTPCEVFWATGAALLVRLAVYRRLGGLDSRFFAHMEEIDLCWRMRSRGYRIACVPSSTVYHVGGGTLQKSSPRKTFLNFRNNLLMLYKNLPARELKPVMRMRCLLDYLAALVFFLKGERKNMLAVFHARKEYRSMKAGFAADRAENLRQTVLEDIPERGQRSLLWAFHVQGRKNFSALDGFFNSRTRADKQGQGKKI